MKKPVIYVLGLRGFPGVQGGIETHCENLYPLIQSKGYDITILGRSPYLKDTPSVYHSIKIVKLWSPTATGLEAFLHSFIGVIYAIIKRPNVLHIHAIGPALFTPLARLFGIKVVVTHHGFDYEREKWGWIAKCLLKTGELMAARFANAFIAVSKLAADRLKNTYKRDNVFAVSNGVEPNTEIPEEKEVTKFGLEAHRYFLSVSRIVEEKRQLDLITAFAKGNLHEKGFKLAVVGSSGGGDYISRVQERAHEVPGVVMTGLATGNTLYSLFHYARAFVHASSLEGNPIVLLEAMNFGLPILASNIPANAEIALNPEEYFDLGDISALATKMQDLANSSFERSPEKQNRVRVEFSWKAKAEETAQIYQQVLQ